MDVTDDEARRVPCDMRCQQHTAAEEEEEDEGGIRIFLIASCRQVMLIDVDMDAGC